MSNNDSTREQHTEGSPNRVFGLMLAMAFLLIAGWPVLRGQTPRGWGAGVLFVLALLAVLKPVLISRVSSIALGALFYGVLTPVAVVIRLAGKDPLRLRYNRAAASHWIARKPPSPTRDSMTKQF
jgi:hypothetical protein